MRRCYCCVMCAVLMVLSSSTQRRMCTWDNCLLQDLHVNHRVNPARLKLKQWSLPLAAVEQSDKGQHFTHSALYQNGNGKFPFVFFLQRWQIPSVKIQVVSHSLGLIFSFDKVRWNTLQVLPSVTAPVTIMAAQYWKKLTLWYLLLLW